MNPLRTHTLALLLLLSFGMRAFAQGNDAGLPPIQKVDYDEHGRFCVNDKPFFPILLYSAPMDAAKLKELRRLHFNVLVCDAKDSNALPAQGFYAAVHPGKEKLERLPGVFAAMGTDSPALVFRKSLIQEVTNANTKVLALMPGRPVVNAIGYWLNEPEGVYAGQLPTKEKYEDLVRAIDVSAPYLYPVPYQPVASVGDAVARARIATDGKKPVVPILQLFVWKATDRYPTPAELRCMAFVAVIEGAHGIGYFNYGPANGRPKTNINVAQPELWRSLEGLNRDIAQTAPRLLALEKSEAFALSRDSAPCKIKAVREGDTVLAVLVNPDSQKRQAKLVWQTRDTIGSLKLQNGESIEVRNGAALVPLEAFGVAIIRWASKK